MKLSKVALLALKGSGIEVKQRIAKALEVDETTIFRYIRKNDDSLTKAAALAIIREVTGLNDEQILDKQIA